MCAIYGWNGPTPTGLIYQLTVKSQRRGKDSTGIAYWNGSKNVIVKQSVPAEVFVNRNIDYVKDAAKAVRGLGHTRKASPQMPINNANAHPFLYGSIAFAHNGAIKNWTEALNRYVAMLAGDAQNAQKLEFLIKAKTDSMVLGPAIEGRDFSLVSGAMGLIWLHGERLYFFRSKKELTSAVITWNTHSEPEKIHTCCVVSSTWEIIADSLAALSNVKYDAVEVVLDEGMLYELLPDRIVEIGTLPVSKFNAADQFSSSPVAT